MRAQYLDRMDIERERGITIKAQNVRLPWRVGDTDYVLHLIDTPGHVDFTYEVSRSLEACEGAILVVDATQGVEAQTIANANLAMIQGLAILPVINKIDMEVADVERTKEEIENALMLDAADAVMVSAKTGIGIEELLEAVVKQVPPPKGKKNAPLRAMIFDSHFDAYQGVVAYVRVIDGKIEAGTRLKFLSTGREEDVVQVGIFCPKLEATDSLNAGEVGYVMAGVKDIAEVAVGDTITDANNPTLQALPGYRKAKPMVYSGIFPTDTDQYEDLRDALLKLKLNDAALIFEPEVSIALGFGFRTGFLGLLHMDITRERLEREFNLSLIVSAPSVVYRIHKTDDEVFEISNPTEMPEPQSIRYVEEPIVNATIMCPQDYIGPSMRLAQDRRGEFLKLEYPSPNRAVLYYKLPLAEILLDFFDQLKSSTRGYASFDYEFSGFQQAELTKLDIMLNGEPVDALSFITHRDSAYPRARVLVDKLKEVVPRQQFEVKIQAAIGMKVIAASVIRPYRKNVTAKCYGGDISRKRKLLEKQREGKKRMKQIGAVEVPQEAFLSVLKVAE